MEGHTGNNTGEMDMDMGGMMMMQMYFYVSSKATILFQSWNTTSAIGMFGSFIAVFLMAMVYESIKVLRSRLLQSAAAAERRARREGGGAPTEYTQLTTAAAGGAGGEHRKVNSAKSELSGESEKTGDEKKKVDPVRAMFSEVHIRQTLLHFVQATLGYSLMLVAMTFNLWLFLAVVTGMTAGYFAFGWMQTQPGVHDDCCA